MSLVYTKQVKEVMININKVDAMLKKIDYKIKYGKTVWYQILIIMSGLLMVVIIAAMQIHNIKVEHFKPISLDMWILLLYPLVVLYDMNSQYGITATLIYQRFKMINEILIAMKKEIITIKTKAKTESTYKINVFY